MVRIYSVCMQRGGRLRFWGGDMGDTISKQDGENQRNITTAAINSHTNFVKADTANYSRMPKQNTHPMA